MASDEDSTNGCYQSGTLAIALGKWASHIIIGAWTKFLAVGCI